MVCTAIQTVVVPADVRLAQLDLGAAAPQPVCQPVPCMLDCASVPGLVLCYVAQPVHASSAKATSWADVAGAPVQEEPEAWPCSGGPVSPSASAERRERRRRAAARARLGARAPDGRGAAAEQACGLADIPGEAACAGLAKDLQAGGEASEAALAALRGRVAPLSFDAAGCRTVQQALQSAECRVCVELVGELRGRVWEAIQSPHANYVIQKIVEVMPTAHSAFIVQELRGIAAKAACHRYGCRVLCRLLEHCEGEEEPAALLGEALANTLSVCRHAFGHYVVQVALEHGPPELRRRVAGALRGDLLRSARHRHACRVLQSALAFCSAEDRQALGDGFLRSSPQDLVALAQEDCGSHAVRALLSLPGRVSKEVLARLRPAAGQLQATKHGRRLVVDYGLAAPAACCPEDQGRS